MAKRQSLGKGLTALMPDVSRETQRPAKKTNATASTKSTPAAKSGSAAKPSAKPATKSGGSAPKKASPVAAVVKGASTPPRRELANSALEVQGLRLLEVPIKSVTPNPAQPRTVFDEDALAELVFSIKEIGLLQPIVVRRKGQGYELIAGERRLRAAKKAGLKDIPALVRDTSDDVMLRDALLENLHRSQLTSLEEAAAYQQLLQDFGCTQEQLATRLGRSRPQITNTLRLLNLPPTVQRRVAAGVLTAGHARALLALDNAADIEKLASRIVSEGLSVRTVEEIISIGEGGAKKGSKASPKKLPAISAPGLDDLGRRLSERLDTRARVTMGRARGKVTIEFATLSDLQRIVDIIDPRVRSTGSQPEN